MAVILACASKSVMSSSSGEMRDGSKTKRKHTVGLSFRGIRAVCYTEYFEVPPFSGLRVVRRYRIVSYPINPKGLPPMGKSLRTFPTRVVKR